MIASSRRARLAACALLVLVLTSSLTTWSPAGAAPLTSGGWTTDARVQAGGATVTVTQRGASITVSATVSSSTATRALVDLEVVSGTALVHQRFWDARRFSAGQTRTFTSSWTVPSDAAVGRYTVRVGVFRTGWAGLLHWNGAAGSFEVGSAPPPTATTTTTTAPATTTTTTTTTTTAPATTTTTTTTTAPPTTPPTTTPGGSRFTTLPVGASLPSGAECAARVRPAAEIRPQNAAVNATRGAAAHPQLPRVDGQFTGTTDQILQWAACKWGIDEDLVRAQIARESWWQHATGGDLTNDQNSCHPWLRTSSGPCPESYGLGQVRYLYHTPAMDDSIRSSAYNVDYVYAVWRDCFEGRLTWLNTVERGREYAAGDMWGCLGVWFSGRWYTSPAVSYMGWVREYLDGRIWETAPFITYRG